MLILAHEKQTQNIMYLLKVQLPGVSFRTTSMNRMAEQDMTARRGSNLSITRSLNHTLLYHLFLNKWDRNVQNENHAVLKKT